MEIIYECPYMVETEKGKMCPHKQEYMKSLVFYEHNQINGKQVGDKPVLVCPDGIRIENGQKICMVVQENG